MRRPPPLPAPPSPARDDDESIEAISLSPHRAATDGERSGADATETVPIVDDRVHRPAVVEAAQSDVAIGAEDVRAEPRTATSVWKAARARRRKLRAEVRRFTVGRRRRRIAWLAGIGAVLLLVVATVGIAYSPLFAVERIEVVGTTSLDPAAVAQALDGQRGTPLALVDSSEVKAALMGFPLIETYALEARPPHDLVVRIVERTPVGQLDSPAGYTLVDAAGVVLSTTPDPVAGFPVLEIDGGTESPVFDAVATVYRALPPEIAVQVTSMTATTPNDVTLSLGEGGAVVVWGNDDRSPEKAVVLAAAMAASPLGATSVYDVSSPGAVVVR